MKKSAYTLIELIFVIVIIGILSAVGFYYFKPHYLQNDRDFLELQLNTVRYTGINYDKRQSDSSTDLSIGCIIKDDFLQPSNTIDKHYKSHADITMTPDKTLLCFDRLGRLYDNNETTSKIYEDIHITLEYNDEEKYIIIDHTTGDLR